METFKYKLKLIDISLNPWVAFYSQYGNYIGGIFKDLVTVPPTVGLMFIQYLQVYCQLDLSKSIDLETYIHNYEYDIPIALENLMNGSPDDR